MELTIHDLRQLIGAQETPTVDNKMIGKYVIVRCRDAGVHCGVLESHNGRECVLTDSRRLWYWKPANGAAFLSGMATAGPDKSSKISRAVERIHLTEDCEIIQCSSDAERGLRDAAIYNE